MQIKAPAAVLLLTPVLTASLATADTYSSSTVANGSDDSDYGDDRGFGLDIPSSILNVLETAIPATWYGALLDPVASSSIMNEIEAGTLPAWYSSLPNSVKAWATSQGDFASDFVDVTATDGLDSSVATSTVNTADSSIVTITSAQAQTLATSAGQTVATSGTAASSKSFTPLSEVSTGGTPLVTGGIAMSFAGAGGLLVLALAL
ncbi:hypothetical protein N7448_010985 [Penicillium atrosanguineum]|nr:hypothetical protein N7448_010985 [Penicillium atrosanguineum]